jgi:hypothetical protein
VAAGADVAVAAARFVVVTVVGVAPRDPPSAKVIALPTTRAAATIIISRRPKRDAAARGCAGTATGCGFGAGGGADGAAATAGGSSAKSSNEGGGEDSIVLAAESPGDEGWMDVDSI